MTEQDVYERDWNRCDRCKTRRKLRDLAVLRVDETTREVPDKNDSTKMVTVPVRTNIYACTDLGWCSRAAAEPKPVHTPLPVEPAFVFCDHEDPPVGTARGCPLCLHECERRATAFVNGVRHGR